MFAYMQQKKNTHTYLPHSLIPYIRPHTHIPYTYTTLTPLTPHTQHTPHIHRHTYTDYYIL